MPCKTGEAGISVESCPSMVLYFSFDFILPFLVCLACFGFSVRPDLIQGPDCFFGFALVRGF